MREICQSALLLYVRAWTVPLIFFRTELISVLCHCFSSYLRMFATVAFWTFLSCKPNLYNKLPMIHARNKQMVEIYAYSSKIPEKHRPKPNLFAQVRFVASRCAVAVALPFEE